MRVGSTKLRGLGASELVELEQARVEMSFSYISGLKR